MARGGHLPRLAVRVGRAVRVNLARRVEGNGGREVVGGVGLVRAPHNQVEGAGGLGLGHLHLEGQGVRAVGGRGVLQLQADGLVGVATLRNDVKRGGGKSDVECLN